MVEEPFGPIAPLTSFTAYDDVMDRTNSLPVGLAGYVFTRDIGLAARASEDKESGMGREGGRLGIQDYLVPKLVRRKI